jgi:hypothetical protein
MENKLKQHLIIFLVVGLFIHLCTAFLVGTIDFTYFSRDMRECELIMFIFVQVLAHYGWINREKILQELKK